MAQSPKKVGEYKAYINQYKVTVPSTFTLVYMGVSRNRGKTPKWMVRENPIRIDDLGVPLFLETPIWTTQKYPLNIGIT